MQYTLLRTFTLCLFTILTNCSFESSSLSTSESGSSRILVVLNSGRDTCELTPSGDFSPLHSQFYKAYLQSKGYIQGVRSHYTIEEVLSCYTANGRIWFLNLEKKLLQANEHGFISYIEGEQDSFDHRYIVGHSYGGWLSMHIGAETRFDYEALFTIDPISKINCTFTYPVGCKTYPQDFNKEKRETIRANTFQWTNIYQNKTWYLHSASIPEAHRNIKVNMSHTNMVEDQRIWGLFNDAVLNGH
jgi:hypothetical protein